MANLKHFFGGMPFLLASLVLYTACGSNTLEKQPSKKIKTSNGYRHYELYDHECQKRSTPYLESKAILYVDYNTYWQRKYKNEDSIRKEQKYFQLQSNISKLKICQQSQNYPENYIESIALSSAATINKSYEFYKKVLPNQDLPAVKLSIFPVYDTVIEEKNIHAYYTDNLAYFPESQKIAIFPQRETTDLYLWGYPFVLAHEFAHHIENQHPKVTIPNNDVYSIVASRPNTNQRALISRAFTEGFADLIAFYSQMQNDKRVTEIPCLGANRSLLQNSFADKTPKRLTPRILHSLTTSKPFKQNATNKCYSLTTINPYHVGSILAFQAHKVFKIATQEVNLNLIEESKLFYKLTMQWMTAVHRLRQTSFPIKETDQIKTILQALKETVTHQIRKSILRNPSATISQTCQQIKRGFPAVDWPCPH